MPPLSAAYESPLDAKPDKRQLSAVVDQEGIGSLASRKAVFRAPGHVEDPGVVDAGLHLAVKPRDAAGHLGLEVTLGWHTLPLLSWT